MVEPYTQQEAFNRAYLGILGQGRASITENGMCVYNGPDETHCAIGWLIPPEYYDKKFDKELTLVKVMSRVPALRNLDYVFLSELRSVHDNAADIGFLDFIEKFKKKAQAFATKYSLTMPE